MLQLNTVWLATSASSTVYFTKNDLSKTGMNYQKDRRRKRTKKRGH